MQSAACVLLLQQLHRVDGDELEQQHSAAHQLTLPLLLMMCWHILLLLA